jgi:hypothetical protein
MQIKKTLDIEQAGALNDIHGPLRRELRQYGLCSGITQFSTAERRSTRRLHGPLQIAIPVDVPFSRTTSPASRPQT